MKNRIYILILMATILGCGETTMDDGFTYTEGGFAYKFHKKNNSSYKISETDIIVQMDMFTTNLDGKVLIKQSDSVKYKEWGYAVHSDSKHFSECLLMMNLGDSATFKVSAERLFGPKMKERDYPQGLTKSDTLLVNVAPYVVQQGANLGANNWTVYPTGCYIPSKEEKRKRDSTANLEIAIAPANMAAYFFNIGIMDYLTDTSGTCYKITKKSNGLKAEKGDSVSVEFDIKTFAGADVMATKRVGKPYTFKALGIAVKGEVYGFHDVLLNMREGEEAEVAIPFSRGFGDRPMSKELPAYSTLVGTIKLLKVYKTNQ